METFHYNQVTLGPLKPVDGWQPEPGQTLIHSKNGKQTVVMLVSLEGNWQERLFKHMSEYHNLTLVDTEMNDIKACIYPLQLQEDQAIVNKDQLAKWLEKIEAANKFRAEVATDIGHVVESIHNVVKNAGDNPMKLVQKLAMGKFDVKALGLDVEQLQAIGAKYAPDTVRRIQEEELNKK